MTVLSIVANQSQFVPFFYLSLKNRKFAWFLRFFKERFNKFLREFFQAWPIMIIWYKLASRKIAFWTPRIIRPLRNYFDCITRNLVSYNYLKIYNTIIVIALPKRNFLRKFGLRGMRSNAQYFIARGQGRAISFI